MSNKGQLFEVGSFACLFHLISEVASLHLNILLAMRLDHPGNMMDSNRPGDGESLHLQV